MPRHACAHRPLPLKSTVEAGLWTVHTYERGRCPDEPSHDIALVAAAGGGLRLAVADAAVNNTVDNGAQLGHLAVDTARAHLRVGQRTDSALRSAAADLHDETVNPMRGPMAAVAVADLDPWGAGVRWTTMADCEVWTQDHRGRWTRHGVDDMLTPSGRAIYAAAAMDRSNQPAGFLWRVQESLDLDVHWTSPALGTQPVPTTLTGEVTGVRRVVVSTDGAELDPERLDHLPAWLNGELPSRDPGKHPHPHGDVTVIDATLTA